MGKLIKGRGVAPRTAEKKAFILYFQRIQTIYIETSIEK